MHSSENYLMQGIYFLTINYPQPKIEKHGTKRATSKSKQTTKVIFLLDINIYFYVNTILSMRAFKRTH